MITKWEIIEDNGSMSATPLGPPKPYQCVAGAESHDWTLTIEEGNVTISTNCNLCDDGMNEVPPEVFEMDGLPVKIEWFHENQGDDSYSYITLKPQVDW